MSDQKNTASASGNTFEQFCENLLKARKEAKAQILQFLGTASEEEVNKFHDELMKMCIKVSVSSIAKTAWEGFNPEQREQAQRRIREVLQPGHIPDVELMYQGSDMKRLDLGDSEITISFTGPRSESVELVTLVGCEHPKFKMSVSGSDKHGWFQVSESGMVFPRRSVDDEEPPIELSKKN